MSGSFAMAARAFLQRIGQTRQPVAGRQRMKACPHPHRPHGTGSLVSRVGKDGCETWYARFYVGQRQIRRRLGPKRSPAQPEALTRAQAERALRQLIVRQLIYADYAPRAYEAALVEKAFALDLPAHPRSPLP